MPDAPAPARTPRRHLVITGTGRSGTTFLVELLTHLGLDTGFTVDELSSARGRDARAGLEQDIRKDACPYVAKSPWFCDYAAEVLARRDIAVDHVLVPMRDLAAAAESRRRVEAKGIERMSWARRLKHAVRPKRIDGGLVHTRSRQPGVQEDILLKQWYDLLLALSDTPVPVTLLRYPRITRDGDYLFEKLEPLLPGISRAAFMAAHRETVRPEWVHRFSEHDG